MLAALSIVAVLIGSSLAVTANSVEQPQQDHSKVEYTVDDCYW